MQQFKPYYTSEKDAMADFGAKSTASIQKCFRTSDIDEVGDSTHLTFFEMVGNFSFGGYFKKEAIAYAHEFITSILNLPISYVTIFKGGTGVPKDEESRAIWQSLGVMDIREEGMDDVFWGPTGSGGPCGPTTEIYCKNAEGKDVEVWNVVFNQYVSSGSREELNEGTATLTPLATPGIDTGMGLERLVMIAQKTQTLFDTDLFAPYMELLPATIELRHKRIIIDHLRGSMMLIADGVRPSNKEAGYILRRLMRRAWVYHHMYQVGAHVFEAIVHDMMHEYGQWYPDLIAKAPEIREVFVAESMKFSKTLEKGMKELEKAKKVGAIDAVVAFRLFESQGLPYEVIKELSGDAGVSLTRESFDEQFKKHQAASRAGAEKKFGGHGLILDTGELKAANEEELKKVTRLHTATHLLQAALRHVLGGEVSQKGSDITAERMRFDFTFSRKMTPGEIAATEQWINDAVAKDFPMQYIEMPLEEAQKTGALYFFGEKYPERVKVYFAGHDIPTAVSKEFCGGPHVTHTAEVGKFKITKEEAVAAGVRRIRAIVE